MTKLGDNSRNIRDNISNLGHDGVTPKDSIRTDGVTFEDGQTQHGDDPKDKMSEEAIQSLRVHNAAISEKLEHMKRFQEEFMSINAGNTPTRAPVPPPNTHGEISGDQGRIGDNHDKSANDRSKSKVHENSFLEKVLKFMKDMTSKFDTDAKKAKKTA
ncbi:hypothetical protein K7X08_000435 [Anisodus acutangulus]|uniref:Uncharacterized protein n=1 Tax=Anisodus acutangulus TaxID=402998 RepID=A0A9Q1RE36_9SOLA|nr:hypothetical protein K7X08_000435 [Anisodus acutangulus]